MAVKTKKVISIKRQGNHHRHGKSYKQVYWPYLPLLGISFVILLASFMPARTASGETLAYATNLNVQSLLTKTNEQRAAHQSSNLKLNTDLNRAAQAKAQDMANRDYWSHQTPDGQEPWVFIDSTGYDYIRAGENLAYGFASSEDTVQGWMNSPSHRDNLLDPDFAETGFGFANAADFQDKGPATVVVALYGRPTALGVPDNAAPVTNTTAGVAASSTVNRVQSLFGLQASLASMLVGVIGGAAATGLFINHGLRLRKLALKGEHYFVAHPLMDVSLLLLIVAAFNFSRVVGYIH